MSYQYTRVAEQYAKDCSSGAKPVPFAVKQACSHWLKIKQKESFNDDKLEQICKLIETMSLPASLEEQKFTLLDWQVFALSWTHGFERQEKTRLFNQLHIIAARKAGKSCFSAAVLLATFIMSKHPSPLYLVLGTGQEHREHMFGLMRQIISMSPDIAGEFGLKHTSKRITKKDCHGAIQHMEATRRNLEGFAPEAVFFDETARSQSDHVLDVLTTGMSHNKNSLMITCSSGGDLPFSEYDNVRKLSSHPGKLESYMEAGTISLDYGADFEDDIRNPITWSKSQPSMGALVSPSFYEHHVDKLGQDEFHDLAFRTRLLCQRDVVPESRWIEDRYLLTLPLCEGSAPKEECEHYIGATFENNSTVLCLLSVKDGEQQMRFHHIPGSSLTTAKEAAKQIRLWEEEYQPLSIVAADYDPISQVIEALGEGGRQKFSTVASSGKKVTPAIAMLENWIKSHSLKMEADVTTMEHIVNTHIKQQPSGATILTKAFPHSSKAVDSVYAMLNAVLAFDAHRAQTA